MVMYIVEIHKFSRTQGDNFKLLVLSNQQSNNLQCTKAKQKSSQNVWYFCLT